MRLSELVVALTLLGVLPAVILLILARRADLADVYDPPKDLRQRFLMAGTVCYLIGYVFLFGIDASSQARWMAATFALGAACVWLIDRWWKISIHNAGAGGGAALMAASLDPAWWPVVGLLPALVGWARWRAGAHSVPQLAAGAALGAAVALSLRAGLT
jgi:hypothetical protein